MGYASPKYLRPVLVLANPMIHLPLIILRFLFIPCYLITHTQLTTFCNLQNPMPSNQHSYTLLHAWFVKVTLSPLTEAVTECSADRSGGWGAVPRSSLAGGTVFSPVVKWSNHLHVAQIPYLQRFQSSGARGGGDAWAFKRLASIKSKNAAAAQAETDHQCPVKMA